MKATVIIIIVTAAPTEANGRACRDAGRDAGHDACIDKSYTNLIYTWL
jgi:hypothetical protein